MADRINQNGPSKMDTKSRASKAILARKRLLVTIFIVSLVIVYCSLGMSYIKKLNEHGELTSQLIDVKQTLNQIPQPPTDLEQRLDAAQTLLAAEQGLFPSEINTTQLINTILALATSCGVKATPMITQPWSTETVGEHIYPVLQITVEVEGSFSEVMTFTSQLEDGDYDTLVMKSLSINRSTDETEEGATLITGTLRLTVYTRSLSSD
jgi:Tfp pilus assembly protein PilO